jgi:hypothetical protein
MAQNESHVPDCVVLLFPHPRQLPKAFQRMVQMIADDELLLSRLQPEITGHPTLVFIDAPGALLPVRELAGPQPSQWMNCPVYKPSDPDGIMLIVPVFCVPSRHR